MLTCWVAGLLIWQLNNYVFKHPTTRIIPSHLRHTWFAGLSIVIAIFIFCLPIFLTEFWPISTLIFAALLVLFRKKGLKLLIADLRLHIKDGRGLFEHSEDCYMTGGKTATFMKNMIEERQILNPFDRL
jgi:hypothetical protein